MKLIEKAQCSYPFVPLGGIGALLKCQKARSFLATPGRVQSQEWRGLWGSCQGRLPLQQGVTQRCPQLLELCPLPHHGETEAQDGETEAQEQTVLTQFACCIKAEGKGVGVA